MIGRSEDIQAIDANLHGKDYVIGDLHGNKKLLKKVLDQLELNDRLFLVGDLTDRGKDSLGVVELINEVNAKSPGRIQVIRGNHEDLTIDNIKNLELVAHILVEMSKDEFNNFIYELKNASTQDRTVKNLQHHIKNGGEWLLHLFRDELEHKKIEINNGEITYQPDSKINMLHDYMNKLPYIMHVKGDNTNMPFNIVHADMPINDKELQKRIEEGKGLSEEEKNYATWARNKETASIKILDKGRSSSSILTIVGHDIVEGDIPPVRQETNTIDLDIASYKNNVSAVYCATERTCTYVGSVKSVGGVISDENLFKIQYELKIKAAEQELLKSMYAKVKKSKSPENIKKILLKTAKEFSEHPFLPKKYRHNYDSLFKFALNTNAIDIKKFQIQPKPKFNFSDLFSNFFTKKPQMNKKDESPPEIKHVSNKKSTPS